MLDHITLAVKDFDVSRAFYIKVLETLGYSLVMEFPSMAGFGADGKPDFWVGGVERRPGYWAPGHVASQSPLHVAFQAKTRAAVRAFHAAALAAGGRSYGEPGVRAQYHPNYYGAFVIDPDGNNVEAVVHTPE